MEAIESCFVHSRSTSPECRAISWWSYLKVCGVFTVQMVGGTVWGIFAINIMIEQ